MRLLLCLLSAPVATSLRAAPHFRLLQTGVAAGVAMMGTDGAKATIEVDGVMVDVGGMSRIFRIVTVPQRHCVVSEQQIYCVYIPDIQAEQSEECQIMKKS